jgi:hypothetical protein
MASGVSLDDQIAEVNRELKLRLKMYPKWMSLGQLKRADANKQYNALLATRNSLERLQGIEEGQQASLSLEE